MRCKTNQRSLARHCRMLGLSVVVALSVIPLSASANDLSLPSYTWGVPNGVTDVLDPRYDPSIIVLSMDEVDVWARIRKGFAIPDLVNPLVETHIAWYAARPDHIERTTKRASRYLFHVVQELEKRNMPTELALLPFIESAFNPQAYSSAKAAGMWQFIPSTGLDFKLKQNMFKDERRDVLASTDAALTYLQRLHGMFGDWQLALAAYNWGEGSVQRAIAKNEAAGLGTDFNGLANLMPAETRNYVPKLQAVENLMAAPERYGLTLPKIDNQPYFVTIGKTRDIDVKVAAQLAELPLDEFRALNPQFNRPVITGGDKTQILLPESNAAKFRLNISKWGNALSTWTAHTVGNARERIETIAARLGTTPELLREVNQIPPKMRLRPGSTILVPKSELAGQKDIAPELADRAVMAMERDVPDTRKIMVKVTRRDDLSSIASRYKVSVAQIRDWNNLRQDKLVAGQRLRLEVPYLTAKTPARPNRTVAGAPVRRVATTKPGHSVKDRGVVVRQVKHKAVTPAARVAKKPGT